jgi:hypothetical protein
VTVEHGVVIAPRHGEELDAPLPECADGRDDVVGGDGDVLYAEVLELIPRFPNEVDRVGKAAGGYRVAVYSFDEPSPAEDFYAWDWVDEQCVRLDAAEMRRARNAGWPRTYVQFREVLGNELALRLQGS